MAAPTSESNNNNNDDLIKLSIFCPVRPSSPGKLDTALYPAPEQVEVTRSTTVRALKQQLESSIEGEPAADGQVLIWRGRRLKDDERLGEVVSEQQEGVSVGWLRLKVAWEAHSLFMLIDTIKRRLQPSPLCPSWFLESRVPSYHDRPFECSCESCRRATGSSIYESEWCFRPIYVVPSSVANRSSSIIFISTANTGSAPAASSQLANTQYR